MISTWLKHVLVESAIDSVADHYEAMMKPAAERFVVGQRYRLVSAKNGKDRIYMLYGAEIIGVDHINEAVSFVCRKLTIQESFDSPEQAERYLNNRAFTGGRACVRVCSVLLSDRPSDDGEIFRIPISQIIMERN